MFKFFQKYREARQDNKSFGKAMEHSKLGNPQQALDICLDLLKRSPCNINIRRATLLLQDELGLEIDLPKLNIKSSCEV